MHDYITVIAMPAMFFVLVAIVILVLAMAFYSEKLCRWEDKQRVKARNGLRRKMKKSKAIRAWAKDYRQPFVIEADNLLYKFEVRL